MTNDGKIVILHILNKMDRAGAETLIVNIMKKIDKEKFVFKFLVKSNDEGQYDNEILLNGGEIFRISRWSGFNTKKYKRALRNIYKTHNEIDIVHSHQGSSAYIDLKIAKEFGFKTIAHSHSTFQKNIFNVKEILFRIVSYKTRFIADYYIGCSRMALISRFGKKIVKKPSCVLNNGIDLNLFKYNEYDRELIRNEFKIGEKDILYLCVGRLVKVKNPLFSLKVFEKILEENKNSFLIFAGKGPMKKQIDKLIKKRNIKNVFLVGNVSNVNSFLSAGDALLMPSLKEGFPVTLVEAQNNGINCFVSTNISREVKLSNNIYFEKINEKNSINVWAKKIISTGNNNRYVQNKIIENEFSDLETCNKITKIYRMLKDEQ